MDNNAVFAAASVNRRAFADLVESLSPEQLAAQSLCGKWTVELVAAHLAAAITTKIPAFAVELLKHRGSFDKANDAVARESARRGNPAIIDTIRHNAESHFAPPGSGPRAPLTDVLIHTGDIARPLGLRHDAPADHVTIALQFLTTGRTTGFIKPGSLTGLRLVADDVAIDHGAGAEVRGRGLDLMMAMCGRTVALADLIGPGVAILQGRLAGPA